MFDTVVKANILFCLSVIAQDTMYRYEGSSWDPISYMLKS